MVRIFEGIATIDESAITGESAPLFAEAAEINLL
jgi:high-affinity K+ transport system ATPase subunit B